jgi:thioredoxin 1
LSNGLFTKISPIIIEVCKRCNGLNIEVINPVGKHVSTGGVYNDHVIYYIVIQYEKIMEAATSVMNLGSSADFDSVVLESPVPVLVDFYADWCGPCRMVPPLLEKFVDAAEVPVRVVKVDVDEMPDLAGRYGVMGIPTLVMFTDGDLVDKVVGVPSLNRLLDMIDRS